MIISFLVFALRNFLLVFERYGIILAIIFFVIIIVSQVITMMMIIVVITMISIMNQVIMEGECCSSCSRHTGGKLNCISYKYKEKDKYADRNIEKSKYIKYTDLAK